MIGISDDQNHHLGNVVFAALLAFAADASDSGRVVQCDASSWTTLHG